VDQRPSHPEPLPCRSCPPLRGPTVRQAPGEVYPVAVGALAEHQQHHVALLPPRGTYVRFLCYRPRRRGGRVGGSSPAAVILGRPGADRRCSRSAGVSPARACLPASLQVSLPASLRGMDGRHRRDHATRSCGRRRRHADGR
jgi:hypothetical protein